MKTIILNALLVFFFCSCSKELVDRIPGEWTYTETGTKTVTSATINSTDSIGQGGTATFDEDGTGSLVVNDFATNLLWSINMDSVNLTIDNAERSYYVIENSSSRQEWKTTFVEEENSFSFTTEKTILLTQ